MMLLYISNQNDAELISSPGDEIESKPQSDTERHSKRHLLRRTYDKSSKGVNKTEIVTPSSTTTESTTTPTTTRMPRHLPKEWLFDDERKQAGKGMPDFDEEYLIHVPNFKKKNIIS